MADGITNVGRRVAIKVGGVGLAAAALPALGCSNSEFPYVPPNGSGEQDSGGAPPPSEDSGGGGGDMDSAAPADTNMMTSGGDTGSCTTNANTLVVALSAHPELGSTGGSTALMDSRYSDPVCQGNTFYVVTTGPGQYAAFSSSCTHACCEVTISGSSASCPCHGATFDVATGAVTKGPAKQALPSIPICSDGTSLFIQLK